MKLNKINYTVFSKIDKKHRMRTFAMQLFQFLPDEAYIKFVYRLRNGKKLDLKNPKTFCEKMNWLKLHKKEDRYTLLVDKLRVRDYIEENLGPGKMFPLLGSWKRFEEIDFNLLPNEFVLKCNHDSGSYRIIKDKRKLTEKDYEELNNHFHRSLKGKGNFFAGREYPYKNVKPYIIAEKLMCDNNGGRIKDYKYFCFDGEPVIMYIASDRESGGKYDFFDMEFNRLDIVNIHPNSTEVIKKPELFDEMKEIAAKLSKGMRFVRIDFNVIDNQIYFGEFTFFHAGGFWPMTPEKWEYRLGEKINLD